MVTNLWDENNGENPDFRYTNRKKSVNNHSVLTLDHKYCSKPFQTLEKNENATKRGESFERGGMVQKWSEIRKNADSLWSFQKKRFFWTQNMKTIKRKHNNYIYA